VEADAVDGEERIAVVTLDAFDAKAIAFVFQLADAGGKSGDRRALVEAFVACDTA
jgi:hypothetical protein